MALLKWLFPKSGGGGIKYIWHTIVHFARPDPPIEESTWLVFAPIAVVTEIKPSTKEIVAHEVRPSATIGDSTREIIGHGVG